MHSQIFEENFHSKKFNNTTSNFNKDKIEKNVKNSENDEAKRFEELRLNFDLVTIGTIETIFNKKNGTPRQSGICPQSKGVIHLHKRLFNNPLHALEGMDQFQYVWCVVIYLYYLFY